MMKLVRYCVLFVKRDYEHAFSEQEELVAEGIDSVAYSAWKIAGFMQEIKQGKTAVPSKWLEKGYPPSEYVLNGKLIGMPDEDKKYLRVNYEVLGRYPHEKVNSDEQQTKVLEEIRDALREK